MALALADGSKQVKADPVPEAHCDILKHWALCIWTGWFSASLCNSVLSSVRGRLGKTRQPWAQAKGPCAGFLLSLQRIGWIMADAANLVTDTGRKLACDLDPHEVIAQERVVAVRQWRDMALAKKHLELQAIAQASGPRLDLVYKVLNDGRETDEWNAQARCGLASAVAGRR